MMGFLYRADRAPFARRFSACIAVLALAAACGPSPAAERPTAPPLSLGPATTAHPAGPPRAEAAPSAPDDLVLVVRVNDPEQLLREVVTFMSPGTAQAASGFDVTQIASLLMGAKLAAVADLTMPVDLASVGLRDPSFVVSVAVKQEWESKLAEAFTLRDEGGLLHVGRPHEPRSATERLQSCAFTTAAGRAPTRMVCASDEPALTATAAYLARNVAAEPFDADVRVTLPGKVLRDRRDSPAKAIGAAASARLGSALVEGFLEEIDRIDGDLRFAGANVEFKLALHLSARAAMLSQVLVPRSPPGPPPRAFYRLPADSLVALHTTGALAEDIAPLRKTLAENLEATMIQDGYQSAKTQALRERIEGLLLTGGPLIAGMGVVGGREGADKALAALEAARAKPADEARAEARARSALALWLMVQVDEPAERWTQGLRDVIRRAEDADKTRAPGSRSSAPRDPDGDHVDMRVAPIDPAAKLPKDSLHVEVLIAPRTKGKRPTRKGHLFVVPKGASTWLGYSEDTGAIASRLRLALDDATEAGTLGRSADAIELRAHLGVAAGLISLGGAGLLGASTTTANGLRDAASTAQLTAALGRSGAIMTSTMTADTRPGTVGVALRARATRQVATEIARMLGL